MLRVDSRLGPGLDVLGDGLVPLHAVRADGWRVQLSLPVVEPMPDWLIAELGGRYGKPRAAGDPRASEVANVGHLLTDRCRFVPLLTPTTGAMARLLIPVSVSAVTNSRRVCRLSRGALRCFI